MEDFYKCLLRVDDASEELFRAYSARTALPAQVINNLVDQQRRTLEVELPVPGDPSRTRTFEFAQGTQLLSRLGTTGSVLWDSSVILASLLAYFPSLITDAATIVELGCGIGLLGAYCSHLPGCGRLILTDGDFDVLRMAKANIERNLPSLPTKGQKRQSVPLIEHVQLDWSDPLPRDLLSSPANLILAADVLYNEHIVPHFLSCLEGLSRPNMTPWILAQELRSETVHELFLEGALEKFDIWRFDADMVPSSKGDKTIFSPRYVVYFGKAKDSAS